MDETLAEKICMHACMFMAWLVLDVSAVSWYSYYFSNATQLVSLFTETSFPTGNIHICL